MSTCCEGYDCEYCEGQGRDLYNNYETFVCTKNGKEVGQVCSDGYEDFWHWYDIEECPKENEQIEETS
jgi:hypothetical protein